MKSIHMSNKMRFVGKGVKFERIRRITGYLVGTLDRFNESHTSWAFVQRPRWRDQT